MKIFCEGNSQMDCFQTFLKMDGLQSILKMVGVECII